MAKRKKTTAGGKGSSRPAVPQFEKWGVGRTIAWWSLLALAFITPIAISNLTFIGVRYPLSYDQFDIIKVFFQRVLGLVALTAWSWEMLVRGGKIRRTPVEWLVLAFLAWVTVSTVFSIHPATAFFGKYRRFEGLLSFINYAVIYYLTLQLADRPARIKQIAQAVFCAGVVVGGYGLMQAFGKDILKWGALPFEVNRSFSTYGNPDLLGGFLMFGTFVSLGLALAEKNLVWRGVYWAGFLMNCAVIVTAFTRSAWVGSLAGFFFIALFAIRQRAPWKTEDWVFSGTAAAGVAYFIIRSLGSDNPVMNFTQRVKSIFEFDQGSAKTRFEIWSAAGNAIKDRPFFGFGADTFRLVFPRYKPVEYVKDAGYLSVADNVHNYPLQLAAGIGVPGMLMLYSICGWVAVRSWKLVWTRDNNKNRMIFAGFWAACAAYVVHLFFGLSVTGTSFLLWMSMGVLMAPTAKIVDVRPAKWSANMRTVGYSAAAVIAILAVVGIGYQFRFMSADKAYLMARIGTQGAERTAYAQKAVKLNPWNDMYRAEVGLAYTDEATGVLSGTLASLLMQHGIEQEPAGRLTSWVMGFWGLSDEELMQVMSLDQPAAAAAREAVLDSVTQLRALVASGQQPALREAVDKAGGSLEDTIEFVPWEYDNFVFLANLYNLWGLCDPAYYEKAVDAAERGTKTEPFGPAVRYQYARALIGVGRSEDAVEQLKTCVEMDPAYTEAASFLAGANQPYGNIENALKTRQAGATGVPAPATP